MSVATLRCPACGAAASPEATRCNYCSASLATIACPSCFGMMFRGAQFCSHCGARAERTEAEADVPRLCPRCQQNMNAVVIGGNSVRECTRCEGIWVDAAQLEQICTEREKQSAILSVSTAAQQAVRDVERIKYVPCPVCRQLMNRVNFAQCSGVIVDACKSHGTWFDKDELRRVVDFIRAGGFEKKRARQLEEIKDQQQRLQAQKSIGAAFSEVESSRSNYRGVGVAGDIADFLVSLLDR